MNATPRCGAPYKDDPFVTCVRTAGHEGDHLTHTDGVIVQYAEPGLFVGEPVDLSELAPSQLPQPIVATELAEAEALIGEADGYMKMLDPDRPWLMRTTDGGAWIQCADCDTWIQAEPDMSIDEARALAELHRERDWQHVGIRQPRREVVTATQRMSRRERRQAARRTRRGLN
jgi:hypothetical protein